MEAPTGIGKVSPTSSLRSSTLLETARRRSSRRIRRTCRNNCGGRIWELRWKRSLIDDRTSTR
ncbi:MAG: hypothetical protein MZU79_01075 [Anaerotruncus sp.]|nr:hypothetical protein [Anaerotruncus sp.]